MTSGQEGSRMDSLDVEMAESNNATAVRRLNAVEVPPINVWVDGCYDMTHFGHANSLRQAKALGDRLIVGVHSDEEIKKNKNGRPPVLRMEERIKMLKSIKWVDQVVLNAPYVTTIATLDKYKCAFSIHGDDITTGANGHDTYAEVKNAGRYKEVKRSQGVSTTGLINRILQRAGPSDRCDSNAKVSPYSGKGDFLYTTNKICDFVQIPKEPTETDRVVYIDGAFDLFHPGHLAFIESAKAQGSYLIVGIHDDATVKRTSAGETPIMTMNERMQCVLSCKHVDNVLIAAPFIVSEELLEHFNVSLVAHGFATEFDEDRYEVASAQKKFAVVDSGSPLTTEDIMARVLKDKALYQKLNAEKEKKELDLMQSEQ